MHTALRPPLPPRVIDAGASRGLFYSVSGMFGNAALQRAHREVRQAVEEQGAQWVVLDMRGVVIYVTLREWTAHARAIGGGSQCITVPVAYVSSAQEKRPFQYHVWRMGLLGHARAVFETVPEAVEWASTAGVSAARSKIPLGLSGGGSPLPLEQRWAHDGDGGLR